MLCRAGTTDPDRDRFIMAKGHASLALYAAMHFLGLIDTATMETYCQDGSRLGVHPEHHLPGIDLSTGSLGQGLSVGCGVALGLRDRGSPGRVFVLQSDAECNEGQVWEAAQFAAHHRLSKLCGLIDLNGMQAMGPTAGILDLEPMVDRWRGFGWDAVEVDGHNLDSLGAAITKERDRPGMIVARTVMGKGVDFMEGQFDWHYRTLSPELRCHALRSIEASPCVTNS